MTQPTPQDIANAERRAAIAARFAAAYGEALALTESILGPGFSPVGRHSLVTHQEAERSRREGGSAVAFRSVITAKNVAGETRHFLVEERREVPSWQEGFGALLTEPDASREIEVLGKLVHPHRYEVHWSGFEPDYRPRRAESLAAAREKRQERAVEKEAESAPLFSQIIREEGYVPKPRKGRSP